MFIGVILKVPIAKQSDQPVNVSADIDTKNITLIMSSRDRYIANLRKDRTTSHASAKCLSTYLFVSEIKLLVFMYLI